MSAAARITIAVTMAVGVAAAIAVVMADSATDGRFVTRTLSVHGRTLRSTVWEPPGYARDRRWPCLVFLHGSGESGSDPASPLRIGLGPQLVAHPERWPCLVVFPQKPSDAEEWEEREDVVLAALADVRRHWNVDPERIALTGLSQGGHGAWYLAARHPEIWSAVAPVAAYGRPRTIASRIAGIPVWAFHGLRDDQVLPVETERVVAELRRQRSQSGGGDTVETRMTLYPNANHDSWDSAYADPELPQWLVTRHRKEGSRR